MKKGVAVTRYNPQWPDWFEEIKEYLISILDSSFLRIEHVGSTAVIGMSAKPIIDLTVIIEKDSFSKVKGRLEQGGYIHQGDLGIRGREAFKLASKALEARLPPHHLYVCPEENEELKRHILFRNYLRENKQDAMKYSQVKEELARKFANDRDAYIEGKDYIVKEILFKALKLQSNNS